MGKYILIETSTSLCSISLAIENEIIDYIESCEPKAHAALSAVFIDNLLKKHSLTVKDLDGISVSMGPGSYTGLRAGVSLAKGLSFGGGIKLFGVGTLDVLVWQAIEGLRKGGTIPAIIESTKNREVQGIHDYKYIIPVIDARRMEVYTGVFTTDGKQVSPTEPHILTSESYSQYLQEGRVLFIGDAADKTATIIDNPNATFIQAQPKASSLLRPTIIEKEKENHRDIAYFEPLYLKEFVATVSKKKLF